MGAGSTTIQKIARLDTDSDVLHQIVHGPASGAGSSVPTEGGNVPTAASAIAAVQVVSDAAIANVQAVSDAALVSVRDSTNLSISSVQGQSNAAIAAIAAVAASAGYQAPVAYAAGIILSTANQTVSYNGQVYAPTLAALPFTTSGTFEGAKFRLIQGLAATDLAADGGANLVGFKQTGVGAIPRTLQTKMLEHLSLADFGVVGDMVADDTVMVQAAIDQAITSGRRLHINPVASGKAYRLTAPLTIHGRLSLVGAGTEPFIGNPGTPGTRGAGSWLLFDHPGVGISVTQSSPNTATGVFLDGFGTVRNQPTPTGDPFTPGNFDFDIVVQTADVQIGDDLMLYNPTKGVQVNVSATGGGYGRLRIGQLRGQPLTTGIEFTEAYDLPIADTIRFWPFWADVASVHTWTKANLVSLKFYRCDGIQCANLFTINPNKAIGVFQSAKGTLLKGQFGNVYADLATTSLYVDGGVTGATIQVANMVAFGAGAGSGSTGIQMIGNQTKIEIANLEVSNQAGCCAVVAGAGGNKLSVAQTRISNWNLDNNASVAFSATSGNNIFLASPPFREAGGNSAPITGGGGNFTLSVGVPMNFVEPSNGTSTVSVTNTGSNGANIHLVGNGSATPSKFLRVANGVFQILNNTYGAVLVSLDDAGNLTTLGSGTFARVSLDALAYFQIQTGNPTLNYASAQYTYFDRSTNILRDNLGGVSVFARSSVGVGFNGKLPVSKPGVTGSKGGNAALASLLSALDAYGLITDSTS